MVFQQNQQEKYFRKSTFKNNELILRPGSKSSLPALLPHFPLSSFESISFPMTSNALQVGTPSTSSTYCRCANRHYRNLCRPRHSSPLDMAGWSILLQSRLYPRDWQKANFLATLCLPVVCLQKSQISSVRLWPWPDTLEFGIGVTSKTSKQHIGNRHCYSRIIVSFTYY